MALFPRRIDGRYAMIARQDNENLYLIYSDDLHSWNGGRRHPEPRFPWEFVQIGNCGSPIELDEGWLLLTHGVGPVRRYSIGAVLLDKEDPSKVLARASEPLVRPEPSEREGYVPNVVYTCGAMRHNSRIILPYAVSDTFSNFATHRDLCFDEDHDGMRVFAAAEWAARCERGCSRSGRGLETAYATSARKPSVPASMSTLSASRKMPSLAQAASDPMRAVPASMNSQVSHGETSCHCDPDGSSTPLEHEVRVACEHCAHRCQPARRCLWLGLLCAGGGNRIFGLQLPSPAIIEESERCVAALLDFHDYKSGTDRVDRTRGHQYRFLGPDAAPSDQCLQSYLLRSSSVVQSGSFAASGQRRSSHPA